MARVLVTGASGFIGAHLVRALLARGHEVRCLTRRPEAAYRLAGLPVDRCTADVTCPDTLPSAVDGMQVVYHLAGRTVHCPELHAVNTGGTEHVIRACASQNTPPVLVFVSSLAAAGPALDGRSRCEQDPLQPVSAYGRSKRAAERVAERMAHRLPITVVRPPIVLGEMDPVGVNLFRGIARFGVHVVPGIVRRRYSIIHADDLAELLILAAERGRRLGASSNGAAGSSGGYYFAASERDPAYDELGRMIAAALGRRFVMPLFVATPLVWLAASGGELVARARRRPVYLNWDKASELTAGSWICSARAAAAELGFRVAASLPDRLWQTAQWYRRAGWL